LEDADANLERNPSAGPDDHPEQQTVILIRAVADQNPGRFDSRTG
jgi:hypothetical protein